MSVWTGRDGKEETKALHPRRIHAPLPPYMLPAARRRARYATRGTSLSVSSPLGAKKLRNIPPRLNRFFPFAAAVASAASVAPHSQPAKPDAGSAPVLTAVRKALLPRALVCANTTADNTRQREKENISTSLFSFSAGCPSLGVNLISTNHVICQSAGGV